MQWFEDEDFWRRMSNYMFSAERFNAAEEQVSQIISLTAFAGGPILDLCCGPGRHAVDFAAEDIALLELIEQSSS
jgi:ubiquinone/menaquinone biosynthesis C-methylase UbiE